MKRSHKETTDSLRFQISLLNLAVAPHGSPRRNPGATAARKLTRLAAKIPAPQRQKARSAR